jgi:hypothetical protein
MSNNTTLKQCLSFEPSLDPCLFSLDNTYNFRDMMSWLQHHHGRAVGNLAKSEFRYLRHGIKEMC